MHWILPKKKYLEGFAWRISVNLESSGGLGERGLWD